MESPSISQQKTFLYTTDLELTSQFYEDRLGLKLIIDQGSCRIYAVSDDGWLGFCERKDAPQQRSGVIFTIVIPDVDRWYNDLRA